MKKMLALAAVAGILISTLSAEAINQIERGYISVSTSANTEIAPDVAELSFAVQTSDTKSMQKATLMNKEISDKVLADLSLLLNPANGDYIKTSDFSAQPIYSYSNSKRNLEKYQVSNRVIIHTKSIDKVGTMIDKAIAAGATNVDNLNFSVSNYESQCNDLIVKATKKAHTRAELIAKTSAETLDGIRTLDTNCSANNYNTPRMYKAQNLMGAVAEDSAAGTSTSISKGTVKIYANVNASYFVK